MMMAAIATASFGFTSCDDDPWHRDHDGWNDPYGWSDNYGGSSWGWNNDNYGSGNYGSQSGSSTWTEMAQTLTGSWSGTMDYSYVNDDNTSRTTDQYNVTMKFFQYSNSSDALSGEGVETDYALGSDGKETGETQTLEFKWYIESNGDIYIKYTKSGATFVMDYGSSQTGFHLGQESGKNSDTFYGYMIGTGMVNGDVIYIDLTRDNSSSRSTETRSASAKSFGQGASTARIPAAVGGKLNHRR